MWQALFNISDSALRFLVKILKILFQQLHSITESHRIRKINDLFPGTIDSLRNVVGLNRNDFLKYVSCPGCHCVYTWEESTETQGTLLMSKRCSFVMFPRHPQARYRKACDSCLMKPIKLATGKLSFYPFKVFCYKSLISSIEDMCKRPNFIDICNHWQMCWSDVYCDTKFT